MITFEMRTLIERNSIGLVATVTPDGKPAVSPKGTCVVIDATTIIFGDIRSPNTVRNIKRNPDVEIVYVDVFSRKACRLAGKARYIEKYSTEFNNHISHFLKWESLYSRIKGIVFVTLHEAKLLHSPIYDDGTEEDHIRADWIRYYQC
ncbi:pyridoxamine 5'-phosphate oxidase family protein [Rhizobium rhizogenes]|nr:pyridoxamine 5'-phosphate oxidase family protein [Rhizobium rhizogenes]